MATPSPENGQKSPSSGLKSYWDSPEGKARREKASQRMKGNTNAKKSKPVYMPPDSTHGDNARTSTSLPPEGGYRGVDPRFRPQSERQEGTTEPPPREVKPISSEKFKKAWPKFLLRVHRGFVKLMVGVQWLSNAGFQRFFPKKQIVIKVDDYTQEEAELDRELTELVIEEDLALWISKNRWKAFFLGVFAWFFGGIDVKIEDKKEEEQNGEGKQPGLAAGSDNSGGKAAPTGTQNS